MLVARPLRPARPFKPMVHGVVLSLLLASAARAPALAGEPAQLNAVAVQTYHIAPGPLGATLSSFAVDAGIALSFQPSITEGLISPELSGTFSTQEAVTRLLAGSGLEMVLRSDGSYSQLLGKWHVASDTLD